jgi:rhodanese-related sulfurtransferase
MARSFFARLMAVAGTIFWSPAPAISADVDRIEAQEAKRLVDKGEAVLVDVRSKAAWDLGHAQGALHIPLQEVGARLSELPRNKVIIAYCT